MRPIRASRAAGDSFQGPEVGARTLLHRGISFAIFGARYCSGGYSLNAPPDAGPLMVVPIMAVMLLPISVLTWLEVCRLPRELPWAWPPGHLRAPRALPRLA